MRRAVLAAIGLMLVCALGASHAGAGPVAGTAAINNLEATATNSTPPEDVGRRIWITVAGRVQATIPGRIPRSCRVSRDLHTEHVSLAGVRFRNQLRATPRSGRFSEQFQLEYGGTDEDGAFYDGAVGFGGGTLSFDLVARKTTVAGKRPGKSFKCRRLTTHLQVAVPPTL